MPKELMNGPIKINYNQQDIYNKSKDFKLKNGAVNYQNLSKQSKFTSLVDDDLDLAPYIVRKDRLILELETTLNEMDGHIESTSKLEEQKSAAEDQRSLLLKEIEDAISDIQSHVLNAREMEIEKKAIENECNSLKEQISHLRTLLNDKNTNDNTKQWNYVDLSQSESTMRANLVHATNKNQLLEKEVKKLRLANERLHLQEKSNKGSADFEQLQRDYLDLQKLLQVAENSEDNIAHELATCHQTIAQMKDDYEQLDKVKGIIEEERDELFLRRAELEMEIKRLYVTEEERDALILEKTELEMELRKKLDDKENCNVIDEIPNSRMKKEFEIMKRNLELNEERCKKLQEENSIYKKRVEESMHEENGHQQDANARNQHLKSAMVKLNKENSQLQISLEKAENEVSDLKSRLANDQKSQLLRPAFEKLNKENSELQLKLDKTEQELAAIKICLEEERESKKVEEASGKKPEKIKKKVLKLKDSKKSKKDKKDNDDSEGIKDEVEVLKKEKFDLTSECQALSETITKIAGEKRTMDKENEELKNEKNKLEGKISELELLIKELELTKEKKDELEQKYQETELCLAQVSAELEKTVENKTLLNEKFQKVSGEKETLVSEQKDFEESLQALKQEMDVVRKDLSNKTIEIRLLRKKHEEEKKKLIGMKDGGDKEITRIKNELKDISCKVLKNTDEDIEHDSHDVITAIERLHEEVSELSQTNSQIEKSRGELQTNLNVVNKQVEELQKESAKASDMAMEKAVELSRTKRSLERKIEKLTKENTEYRKKLGAATPAMSVTPRLSPETIQVHNTEIVESKPISLENNPPSQTCPSLPSHLPPQAPPRQRPPSQPIRMAEAYYEGSSKSAPLVMRPEVMEFQSKPARERDVIHTRPGNRSEGAESRPPGRSPPPYPLAKRSSLDNGLMSEKERGSRRELPAYPSRDRRSSETRGRPPSASVANEDRVRSPLESDRRRSDGGYSYHKRVVREGERYRNENRPSEQVSAFRVVGQRRKVLHEDYV